MRLLLAEDEKDLSRALAAILKHNHYDVDAVYDGAAALESGLTENYDGLILDIMMPKMNGLDVLDKLRKSGRDTPVLMLTAKGEIEDRIVGLDKGADDYLSKPFAMGELLARVRAMTRRRTELAPGLLKLGSISLNRSTFELSGQESSFRLGNKEFQMMEMFMGNPNRMITVEQFMERIWDKDKDTEENVVLVYVSYLRKKLIALGAKMEIRAVNDVGYILEE